MKLTRNDLIRSIAAYAQTVQGPIRLIDFCRLQRISPAQIYLHFPGGVYELLCAAGIGDRVARIGKLDRQTLMLDLHQVAAGLGRPPTRKDIIRLGRISQSSYHSNFGSWPNVLRAYEMWKAERDHAAARVADRLPGPSPTPPAPPPMPLAIPDPIAPTLVPITAPTAVPITVPVTDRPPPALGTPLGFRGLLHAPTTESGVVHLFGVLAKEVGLAVEHIGAPFPDCTALRPDPDGKWRRIAVEFELRSSNFRLHGHDAAKCDLIICWEHDWKDCNIQVIELKEVMRRAMGEPAQPAVVPFEADHAAGGTTPPCHGV